MSPGDLHVGEVDQGVWFDGADLTGGWHLYGVGHLWRRTARFTDLLIEEQEHFAPSGTVGVLAAIWQLGKNTLFFGPQIFILLQNLVLNDCRRALIKLIRLFFAGGIATTKLRCCTNCIVESFRRGHVHG